MKAIRKIRGSLQIGAACWLAAAVAGALPAYGGDRSQELGKWAQGELAALERSCGSKDAQGFLKGYGRSRSRFKAKVQEVKQADLEVMIASEDPGREPGHEFLNLGRELWPDLLPGKFPLRQLHLECLKEREELISRLQASATTAMEALSAWRSCTERHFAGRVPAATRKLTACLADLASRRR